MIKSASQPDERELPFHGLSINVTLTFESAATSDCMELKSRLSRDAIYSQIETELVDFADVQIQLCFNSKPWRRCTIGTPHAIWDNDEDEFVPAELTPLVLLGLEFDIRMRPSCYDALVHMIESDEFCAGCETIVAKQLRIQLDSIDWNHPTEIEAEVVEFGGG